MFLRRYDPPPSAAGLEIPRGPNGAGDRSQAADGAECGPDPGAQAGGAAGARAAHGGAGPLFPPGAAAPGGLRPQAHAALLTAISMTQGSSCWEFRCACAPRYLLLELGAWRKFGACVLLAGRGVPGGGGAVCFQDPHFPGAE